MGQPVSETQHIPRKPASTPGVPRLCRAVGVPLRVVQQQRPPERENLERQERQLSVIDMWPVIYTLSVFINKMHSEAHGHQTKHSTGQGLRTAQEAILLQQLCSLKPQVSLSQQLLTLRHANKLSQAGRRLLILILRGFLTWIETRKMKLRSTHNYEEN